VPSEPKAHVNLSYLSPRSNFYGRPWLRWLPRRYYDDLDLMKRVNAYVKRHLGQGPKDDVEDSNWRYSLMNWGHEPFK
jgi:Protein of unknown function (DUF3140)